MMRLKNETKNAGKVIKLTSLLGLSAMFIVGGVAHTNLYAATITSVAFARQMPDGYSKPNYVVTVKGNSEKATDVELAANDAAEIMSQEIYRYLGTNISGKTLEISYRDARRAYKSSWQGYIKMDPMCTISVNIDSVTGEINFVSRTALKPVESIKNDGEIVYHEDVQKKYKNKFTSEQKKVETLIAQSGVLPEQVKSITYDRLDSGYYYDETHQDENHPLGELVNHEMKVETVSGKVYVITLSEDFTRIEGIETPEYVKAFEACLPVTVYR